MLSPARRRVIERIEAARLYRFVTEDKGVAAAVQSLIEKRLGLKVRSFCRRIFFLATTGWVKFAQRLKAPSCSLPCSAHDR